MNDLRTNSKKFEPISTFVQAALHKPTLTSIGLTAARTRVHACMHAPMRPRERCQEPALPTWQYQVRATASEQLP